MQKDARSRCASAVPSVGLVMQSGIPPLDMYLGGIQPGRLHLLTGGPGAGKSAACLQFLRAGLQLHEAGVLITLDSAADLLSHAHSIGMELGAHLRQGRLLIARYCEPGNDALEAASATAMVDELSRLIAEHRPVRFAVDPLTPFLSERNAWSAALAALAELLDRIGCTTLLTYHNDLSHGYDARLGPIVQKAAAIVHLTRDDGGVHRMRAVQTRWRPAPEQEARFTCTHGVGLVPLGEEPSRVVELVIPPRKTRTRAPKSST
jgi:KaiC/GvpD/RAD55 family RecA-like ATPase